jgi:hypothetical protein
MFYGTWEEAMDGGVEGVGVEREQRWCDWTIGRLRQGVLFGAMTV